MRITARLTGGVLAALAVLHLAWGLGSAFPFRSRRELADAVVGSSRVPPPTACFAVAGALATGTALVVKVIPLPPPVRRESLFGMAAVFGVRFGLLWEDGSRFSRQRLREVHSSRPANLRADMSWAVDWLGGFHGSTIRSDVDTSRSQRTGVLDFDAQYSCVLTITRVADNRAARRSYFAAAPYDDPQRAAMTARSRPGLTRRAC